jgi:hypothetical protein
MIPFGFRDAEIWKCTWFSPGTFHSPASILTVTLRTQIMITFHITQSHDSTPSLTKTSVFVCLKNINKEPSQQFGVLYRESYGSFCGFEHLYIVTWLEKEMVKLC